MLARYAERTRLDDFLHHIRDGSSTLLLDGGAGIGKTALLDYLVERAPGVQLLKVTGTQSEVELAYAALHRLCRPLMDVMPALPVPQRQALETTFGLGTSPFPGKFLVGLAVLSLLSEASRSRPVLCVVDDAQWLDKTSAEVLGFVARRLEAESVGMVFAVRSASDVPQLEGITRLTVGGLEDAAARLLLSSLEHGPIDPNAMERIVDEADGNPLVLIESARAFNRGEIETGIILTAVAPDPSNLEEHFGRRLKLLPADTQQLLLIAAAEPMADPQVIQAAAVRLRISPDWLEPAVDAGLCHTGVSVRFRHPLVRSAAYRTGSPAAIRAAHAALASVMPDDSDPVLLAWHRAQACETTDEDVSLELMAAASRVSARGAPAAAAALLRQAQQVTAHETLKAECSVRIAQAELAAGEFDGAERDLAGLSPGLLSPELRAEAKLTEARLAFARQRGGAAVPLLLEAADQLVALDANKAEQTYLEAFSAALFGGHLGQSDLREVATRWRAAGLPARNGPVHQLLDGLGLVVTDGGTSAWTRLDEALSTLQVPGGRDSPPITSLWVASVAAAGAWDIEGWNVISRRLVAISRNAGDYSELPAALSSHAFVHLFTGDLKSAAEAVEESTTITSITGGQISPYGAIGVAAIGGQEVDLDDLVEATVPSAERRSDATGISISCWGAALLNNSMGRYEDAFSWSSRARPLFHALHASSVWALVELIESASRTNRPADAHAALTLLASATRPSGNGWGLGVLARSQGLVSHGSEAEDLFSEALRLLEPTRCIVDFARTALVYGEWLRRHKRLSDSRTQLGRALQLFESIGATAFAGRAARELQAAGSQVRKPSAATSTVLTTQESQIAQLVKQGLTNDEVATRIFLSPRTVEYHLAKVFRKLEISSRHQLATAAAGDLDENPY